MRILLIFQVRVAIFRGAAAHLRKCRRGDRPSVLRDILINVSFQRSIQNQMSRYFLAFGYLSLAWKRTHIAVVACSEVGFYPLVLYAYLRIEGVFVDIGNLIAVDHVTPCRTFEVVLHLRMGVGVRELNGQLHAQPFGKGQPVEH